MSLKMKQREIQIITTIALLFFFAVVLLSIIPLYRYIEFDGYPNGEKAYYHMRMAEYIVENGIPKKDFATVTPRRYTFDPFHVIIGMIGKGIGLQNTALLLPMISGIITIFIIYDILKSIFQTRKQRLLAAIFILISPMFLASFTELRMITWISMITATALWCFMQKGRAHWCAYFLFPILLFYSIGHNLVALCLLIYIGEKSNKKKETIAISIMIGTIVIIKILLNDIKINVNIPHFSELIQQLLADAGSTFGFSLFGLILAAIGIQYLWVNKKITMRESIIFLFIFIITSAINIEYGIYLNIIISVLAAIGFIKLAQREWKMKQLRNITLFLLILGVVYSGAATVAKGATEQPTPELIEGLTWLESVASSKSVVLSSIHYASIIQQQTKAKVIIDRQHVEPQDTEAQLETVFESRRMDKTMRILKQFDVDFIVITTDMIKGGIWEDDDEGLLFLLENGENFKKRFENNEVIIWEVIPIEDDMQ